MTDWIAKPGRNNPSWNIFFFVQMFGSIEILVHTNRGLSKLSEICVQCRVSRLAYKYAARRSIFQ